MCTRPYANHAVRPATVSSGASHHRSVRRVLVGISARPGWAGRLTAGPADVVVITRSLTGGENPGWPAGARVVQYRSRRVRGTRYAGCSVPRAMGSLWITSLPLSTDHGPERRGR